MPFEIHNSSGGRAPREGIKKIMRVAGDVAPRLRHALVTFAFVSPSTMKRLNARYRGKRRSTTVLSFSSASGRLSFPHEQENFLGEVLLCTAEIRTYARKNDLSYGNALNSLIVHGIVHLLGYDHHGSRAEKRMQKLEHRIISRLT